MQALLGLSGLAGLVPVPAVGAGDVPPVLAGLELWLDADALALSDGAYVESWEDFSGNDHHAIPYVLPPDEMNPEPPPPVDARPKLFTDVVNGRCAVRFDGVDDVLELPDFLSSLTAAEVFVVLRGSHDPPTGGLPYGLWDFGSPLTHSTHYPHSDSVVYEAFGTTVRHTVGNPAQALNQWHVYNVSSAAGAYDVRIGGVVEYTSAVNTVGWPTQPLLGQSKGTPYVLLWRQDMAFLLLYGRVLSSGERASVYGWLVERYGL